MPKKQFLEKPKKKSKHAQQTPSTADEYLAAGVDFEEAGEKWRGGDAAKSTRFFVRAIDCYDEALKIFPTSFDLAYNKARVQYELSQHPKLLSQLPGSLPDLLNSALDSSRYALDLNQDNADVLFNTAQVLTSIVEALSDSQTTSFTDPIPILEESLSLFQRCLSLQELQHTESLAQQNFEPEIEPDNEEGGVSLTSDTGSTSSEPPQDERWAMILEPVTNDTLLDTLLAQLEMLTLLCNLITTDGGKGLPWVEEYASSLLIKLPTYLAGTEHGEEAGLTKANFMAAAADANFRFQRIDVGTYTRAVDEAYSPLDLQDNAEGLVNKAEALLTYNTTLRLFHYPEESLHMQEVLVSRWQALSAALSSLTAASKIPSADNLPKIHLARGDVELLRFQLGQAPANYEVAAKNGPTLLKNAEKFYRGAKTLTGGGKEGEEAGVKEALAAGMGGDIEGLKGAVKLVGNSKGILEDAVEEGVITMDQLREMGFA